MHHIFIESGDIFSEDKKLVIENEQHHHISRVLRMKAGDEISVTVRGKEDSEYRFGIDEILENRTVCTLRFVKAATAELQTKCVLLQGIPKADKMEQIIQKTVELGVSEIVPVRMDRSVVKLDDKKALSRVQRWQKISEAAAMQSKRSHIPVISNVMSFKEALIYTGGTFENENSLRLLPYELEAASTKARTKELLSRASSYKKIFFMIGPEGGFSEKEVEAAAGIGFCPITLGSRILRTETAAITVMSWLMYELEN